MGHLLSSALKMQTAAISEIQYEYSEFVVAGSMAVYFNSNQPLNLTSNTALTTVTLTPASQTISSNVTNPDDTGTDIAYYINDVFIQTFTGTSFVQTGDISTSPGNTYKFSGTAG